MQIEKRKNRYYTSGVLIEESDDGRTVNLHRGDGRTSTSQEYVAEKRVKIAGHQFERQENKFENRGNRFEAKTRGPAVVTTVYQENQTENRYTPVPV